MRSPLPVVPVETVTRLVNGWGSVPRATAGEADTPYPSPAVLLGATEADDGWPEPTDEVLRDTADLLYEVFDAERPADRAERVNQLLARVEVHPALRATGDDIEQVWLLTGDPESWLLASAAVTLQAQLVTRRADRLGTCAGDRCADVYVDASPAGHRRFCSVTCSTRARVAAFRGRAVSSES